MFRTTPTYNGNIVESIVSVSSWIRSPLSSIDIPAAVCCPIFIKRMAGTHHMKVRFWNTAINLHCFEDKKGRLSKQQTVRSTLSTLCERCSMRQQSIHPSLLVSHKKTRLFITAKTGFCSLREFFVQNGYIMGKSFASTPRKTCKR